MCETKQVDAATPSVEESEMVRKLKARGALAGGPMSMTNLLGGAPGATPSNLPTSLSQLRSYCPGCTEN